jgi:protein-tyrosine-phosphatase
MAAVMLRARAPHLDIGGAGTFVIEGQPMSVRTRTALARHGLADRDHRSRQLYPVDAKRADAVVALAPEHVEWVRRTVPDAAGHTVTLHRLVRDLPATPAGPLRARLVALDLARVELEPWEEVVDPAGGEQPDFDACATTIDALVAALVPHL